MNRCPEWSQLAEVDLRVLEVGDDSLMGLHIAECAECGRAAARILQANARLHEALGHAPEVDIDAILARAGLRSVATAEGHRRDGNRRYRRVGLLAAVAASVAALFLLQQSDPPFQGVSPPVVATASGLDVRSDSDLMILPTENPDITVLWFISGE